MATWAKIGNPAGNECKPLAMVKADGAGIRLAVQSAAGSPHWAFVVGLDDLEAEELARELLDCVHRLREAKAASLKS